MAKEPTIDISNYIDKQEELLDLFGNDPREGMVDPNKPKMSYRGENLFKTFADPMGPKEAAGGWYGFTKDKAAAYPSPEREAPLMRGGTVTRSIERMPEEIIKGSHKAMTIHGKTVLDRNLENGVDSKRAYDIYFNYLNKVDRFHEKRLAQLIEGTLPEADFNFMLKTTMAEGVFDRKGPIDIRETFKRNKPVAAAVGIARALPTVAKYGGIATIPLGVIGDAKPTGLDPEEEVAQGLGVDSGELYALNSSNPEAFYALYAGFKQQQAREQMEREAKAEEAMTMVP
jgi:hypothetical protein